MADLLIRLSGRQHSQKPNDYTSIRPPAQACYHIYVDGRLRYCHVPARNVTETVAGTQTTVRYPNRRSDCTTAVAEAEAGVWLDKPTADNLGPPCYNPKEILFIDRDAGEMSLPVEWSPPSEQEWQMYAHRQTAQAASVCYRRWTANRRNADQDRPEPAERAATEIAAGALPPAHQWMRERTAQAPPGRYVTAPQAQADFTAWAEHNDHEVGAAAMRALWKALAGECSRKGRPRLADGSRPVGYYGLTLL